jgi:hypothetical protein
MTSRHFFLGVIMRRTLLTLLLATMPAAVGAQNAPAMERQPLPIEVRREIVARWNARSATAVVASDRLEIAEGHEVRGDVLVRTGPLVISGRITGNVLALNSSVTLTSSARIDGDLLVIGGELFGRSSARVGGSTRIYRQDFQYRQDGERIADAEADADVDDSWWRRLERRREGNWSEALRVVQAGPYNRVEGLPVQLGPVLRRRTSWGSLHFDGAVVVRTATSFNTENGDVGHRLRGEIRVGDKRALGIGATVFSVVEPVEDWQLSNLETALAAFVMRHDYRDYYHRHGGQGFVALYGARNLSWTASYGEARWSSREAHKPFTIFDNGKSWRPNPAVDEGLFHIAATRLSFDTRTDPDDPWSGWYLNAEIERGHGTLSEIAPTSAPRALSTTGSIDYTRGFFDFRRYNRLGPKAQLNLRVALGGWLGGDPLPLERRLSADGPGVLPGFDFRSSHTTPNVGTCNTAPAATVAGRPTECERVAVAQIEYRGDLRLDVLSNWNDWPRHYHSEYGDVAWVLFADAGRGWLVGRSDGTLTYPDDAFPALSTFRTDLGIGLDFGGVGIYAAKALSTSSEPINFFLRLRHRF